MGIKEIAKEAGVSVSTVSRVLNGKKSAAGKELTKKILSIAEKRGYVPNQNARGLRVNSDLHQPPKSLYCLFACSPDETTDDPFFSKLLEYIQQQAMKQNYMVKYIFSPIALSDPEYIYHFSTNPPDYLIVLGRFKNDLFKKLKKHFKKIVYIGLNELNLPCDQIICNGYDMAMECVSYLHSLEHQNIGYLGANEGRFRGYYDAMQKEGLCCSPAYYINDCVLSMEGGFQGMMKLLEKKPDITSVFCANDMVAIGALRACKIKKIAVPEEMSIIGINDIENIQYTDPMLSSVHVPLEEMGKMGVTIIHDSINNGHCSNIKISFPFRIIRRESCSKPKR